MSTITISSTELPDLQETGSGFKLRIYLNTSFVTSDGVMLESGSPDAGTWYKEIDCTLDGTTLEVPSFTIHSTVDGRTNQSARYFAWIYQNDKKIRVLTNFTDGFKVPSSPSTWTWAELADYNLARRHARWDDSVYTKDQTNALIAANAGAPVGAGYLVTTANSSLTGESNLGALSTGPLKITVSGGVATVSTAIAGTDYLAPNGSGASLTGLNASALASGTIPDARFPSTLPALNGSNLTALNASNLASGTIPLARISGLTDVEISGSAAIAWTKISKTVSSLADLTTRSASDLSSGTLPDARFPSTLPALNGSNLTALNASNISSGTLDDARLSTNVTLLGQSIDLSGAEATGVLAAARFPALTGDVTTSAGALATTIANDAVTFAKMQNITTSRLLGRTTASSGDIEELTVGTSLSLSGGSLNTIQGIRTTDTPQFARLGLGVAADATATFYTTGIVKQSIASADPILPPNQVGPLVIKHGIGGTYTDDTPTVGNIYQFSSWGETTGSAPLVGVFGFGVGNAGDSQVWGGNFGAYANLSGASAHGTEINFGALASGGVAWGQIMVYTGTQNSAGAFFDLATSSNGGKPKDGIIFDNNGTDPFQTTGSLIKTDGTVTVTAGIDFSSAVISGQAFYAPNNSGISFKTTGASEFQAFFYDTNNDTIFCRGNLVGQTAGNVLVGVGNAKAFFVKDHNNANLFKITEATGKIECVTGTATATAGAATLSKPSGTVTSESLTTAAAGFYTLTVTNTLCADASQVFASVFNGTNSGGQATVLRVVPQSGSFVVIVQNTGGTAFNGTLKFSFLVING